MPTYARSSNGKHYIDDQIIKAIGNGYHSPTPISEQCEARSGGHPQPQYVYHRLQEFVEEGTVEKKGRGNYVLTDD